MDFHTKKFSVLFTIPKEHFNNLHTKEFIASKIPSEKFRKTYNMSFILKNFQNIQMEVYLTTA